MTKGHDEGESAGAKPHRRKVASFLVGIALLTGALVACSWWSLETRTPPLETKAMAPDFSLPSYDGKVVSLASERAGGNVVVVFYRGHW